MMSNKSQDIKEKFKALLSSKTEEERIERDSFILMANYLSEIERLYKDKGLNRKELANQIKISPSYLTQVFRGDKPLNFLTLAKIKRALNLNFRVTAELISEKKTQVISGFDILSSIEKNHLTTLNIDILPDRHQNESAVMQDFIPISYKDVQNPNYEMTLQKFQLTKQTA